MVYFECIPNIECEKGFPSYMYMALSPMNGLSLAYVFGLVVQQHGTDVIM
jgi:hypothetical protein